MGHYSRSGATFADTSVSAVTNGTTITVSPVSSGGKSIQSAINSAPSGYTIVFTPGTYNVSHVINLESGVNLKGQTGATLVSNGQSGIFQGLGVHNVSISGFTFDGHGAGPGVGSGAIYLDSSTGDARSGVLSNQISITDNVFTNWTNSNDLWLWGTQNTYIAQNTFSNGYEGISWATDPGAQALNNLDITGNVFNGLSDMGIETAFASTIDNIHIDYNRFSNIGDFQLSFVEGETGGNFTSGTVWGNVFDGTNSGSTLVEMGNYIGPDNITVENNILKNADWGFTFSHVQGAAILNNTFYGVSNPFSEDGGFDDTQWVGTNTIDGQSVTGWANYSNIGAEPKLYTPPQYPPSWFAG